MREIHNRASYLEPACQLTRKGLRPSLRQHQEKGGYAGMTVHFCVHDEGDSVGVVVVEGIKSGQALNGWIMDQDKMIAFNARSDIPIGHKLAVRAIAAGDTIIKYGVDIGKAVKNIAAGEHLHVHNVKTKRW
jgi:(2R)-sulfolactate sulfo-lyase subunit alpha